MSKARDLADLAKNANDRLDDVATSDGALSNRNLIINGAMQVAQRGTSATGKSTTGYYSVDRFSSQLSTAGTFTISQATDAPEGFAYSYKVTTTSADTSPTTNLIRYMVEGTDVQHLAYGTTSAHTLTISFWVKSNKTGEYSFNIEQKKTASTFDLFTHTFNVSTAGVWEKKVVTIPPNTSNVIYNANTNSLALHWWLGSGAAYQNSSRTEDQWAAYSGGNLTKATQVNIGGEVNNYFQITGVQLEVGDTATPFEHRSYGDELARCQRYYEVISRATSVNSYGTLWSQPLNTFSNCWTNVEYKVSKRAVPSFGLFSGVSWYNLTPNAYPTVDALVLNASGFFYVSGGSTGDPQAYLDAEL